MKASFNLLIALTLATVLVSCGNGKEDAATAKAEETALKVTDLRDVATRIGVLEPKKQVPLKSEVSGIVTRLHVKEGIELKKGQSILTIDPRPFLNRKQKLLLAQKEVKLELNILKRELDRDSVLAEKGGVSPRKLADCRDKVALKNIALKKIRIDIKDVNEKLEKTILRAPISGTLLYFSVEEGEIVVSATTGYSAGTNIGIIAGTGAMEVICNISEIDYHALSYQTPVAVYLESDPAIRAVGKVSFISKAAKKEEGKAVRTFEIRVDVAEIDPRMVPGINVNVEFVFLDKKGVSCLPVKFVHKEQGPDGPVYFVNVKTTDGGKEKRKITVGNTDHRRIEVLSGITAEETIVL